MYSIIKAVFGFKGIVILIASLFVITVIMVNINTSQQSQLILEANIDDCEPVSLEVAACRKIVEIGVSPRLFKEVESYRSDVRAALIKQTLSSAEKVERLANLTLKHAAKKEVKVTVEVLKHIHALRAEKKQSKLSELKIREALKIE